MKTFTWSSSQQPIEPMEAIMAPIVVQYTQPLHQIVCPSVPIMGTVERPLVQWNILITTTQPTIEVALICAYRQQVGHEFKNYPFVDDKLNRLMKE
jgi:hypothetical protein